MQCNRVLLILTLYSKAMFLLHFTLPFRIICIVINVYLYVHSSYEKIRCKVRDFRILTKRANICLVKYIIMRGRGGEGVSSSILIILCSWSFMFIPDVLSTNLINPRQFHNVDHFRNFIES